MIKAKKPKTFSLEWYYRDENYNGSDIGRAMKKLLKQEGRMVGKEPQYSFDTHTFHYGNATVELVPDHHHYVSLAIRSSKKNECRSVLEEIISNAEDILVKKYSEMHPLDYHPKNFRIPRNLRQAKREVPGYQDPKTHLPYYFGLKITQN